MARQPEPTISAVLIVKDEEEYLARCLESVRWVDEIVVYDTGSSDRTVEIAREFTDTVIEGYWNDDFGDARNRALGHATSEWVLIIDADEQFAGDQRSLRRHLSHGRANLFTVTLAAQVSTPSSLDVPIVMSRIFRRADAHYEGALHEQVVARAGVRLVVQPLPGTRIRHAGYSESPDAMAQRFNRNLELAERELAEAEATDEPDRVALALKRANLARSLCGARRGAEGLTLAEEVYASGDLPELGVELLARVMSMMAAGIADFEGARTWAERARDVVGNPVWADELLVKIAAMENDPLAVLNALECIPTIVVDARGRHVRRVDYARFEVWALRSLDRLPEAVRAAERAAEAGVLAGEPLELWGWLGEDGVRRVVASLPEDGWQLLAVLCTHVGWVPAAHAVLRVMVEVRPGDPATLLCAAKLSFQSDLSGLEEAATWSARMRAAGLEDSCPLISIATDPAGPPAQRARAAALAHFAYGDPRSLDALEAALSLVATEDEAELAAHLDVLAPGLIQHA